MEIIVGSVGAITGVAAADLVGGFPSEIQSYIEFAAGVITRTKEPEAAKALLRFLVSPPTMSVLNANGFELE